MLRLVACRSVAPLSRWCASTLRVAGPSNARSMAVDPFNHPNVSKADIYARAGLSEDKFTKRKVVIYKPARSAMTQGRAEPKKPWKLQFDLQPKWSNPLMGWTSGADTHGTQLHNLLSFETQESAIAYCEKFGMEYTVQPYEESTVNQTVAKQYADNFVWDGDEENGNTGYGHWATRRSGTK